MAEWAADRTTNISVEDLLSESIENNINFTQFPMPVASESLVQMPFSSDSFDAAIAGFIQQSQNKADLEQCVASHGPSTSILDSEQTCDAFSFQRNNNICDKGCSSSMQSPFPSDKEVEV